MTVQSTAGHALHYRCVVARIVTQRSGVPMCKSFCFVDCTHNKVQNRGFISLQKIRASRDSYGDIGVFPYSAFAH